MSETHTQPPEGVFRDTLKPPSSAFPAGPRQPALTTSHCGGAGGEEVGCEANVMLRGWPCWAPWGLTPSHLRLPQGTSGDKAWRNLIKATKFVTFSLRLALGCGCTPNAPTP